jgi:transcriptional regulator with XRE-family HTH domain
MQNQNQHNNILFVCRRQRGLTQKQVAKLMGLKSVNLLTYYEKGISLPSLTTALAFEILYRTPVAFLFPEMYSRMRLLIRERESSRVPQSQQALF